MIQGSCHWGAVRWRFDGVPEGATVCYCTVCRRNGVLWACGQEDDGIDVSGTTRAYALAVDRGGILVLTSQK